MTDDDFKKQLVIEGDPVLFSGLFIQSFRELNTLEPIVRSGSLAMIPEGLLKTTLNQKLGHLYYAEAHSFGGNSGSPMFVDTAKFNSLGSNYKFLGVLSGTVHENADMTLNVTATTMAGNVAANSDVSSIVPAEQLLEILDKPEFKKVRDAYDAAHPIAPPAKP